MFLKDLYRKWKLRNLRKDGAKWVEKNLGKEHVEGFLDKYDKINGGIPIGNMKETVEFLNMIQKIKEDILNNRL